MIGRITLISLSATRISTSYDSFPRHPPPTHERTYCWQVHRLLSPSLSASWAGMTPGEGGEKDVEITMKIPAFASAVAADEVMTAIAAMAVAAMWWWQGV